MSYYFDMCFWSASSLSTAMKKAQEVVAACCTTECMRQTLEDKQLHKEENCNGKYL